MSSELQQNRYDQLIRRVGNLKGPGSKVSEVLTELFPVFDVEHPPPELYILMATDICFAGGILTGLAGERPGFQLLNPVGSSKILTVTSFVATSLTTGASVRWGVTNAVLASGVGTETFRDTRKGITARPTGQFRIESQVALIGNTAQAKVLASDPLLVTDSDGLAILTAGIGFDVGSSVVADTFLVTIYWRERVAEPSEINL